MLRLSLARPVAAAGRSAQGAALDHVMQRGEWMSPDEVAFMARLDSKLLFRLDLQIGYADVQAIGTTTAGRRIVAPIEGGRFEGERLRGVVLPGGADWVTFRTDGAMMIDVRLTLKTDDDALILMFYQGIAQGPPDIMARFNRREVVPVSAVYTRTTPRFETAAPQYEWLNRIVTVSKGARTEAGPMYNVFEIL